MQSKREKFNDEFEKFVSIMREILVKKNHDYTGKDVDPLFNLKKSENMGIPAWKGILVRLSDKMSRMESFAKQEEFQVKDEGIEDTLIDFANYAFLCCVAYKEYKNDKNIEVDENRDRSTISNQTTIVPTRQ